MFFVFENTVADDSITATTKTARSPNNRVITVVNAFQSRFAKASKISINPKEKPMSAERDWVKTSASMSKGTEGIRIHLGILG
jgi:D-arabinose 5-phosphate isomerase GutQ